MGMEASLARVSRTMRAHSCLTREVMLARTAAWWDARPAMMAWRRSVLVVVVVVLWGEEEGGMRSAGWMGTRMDASTLSRTGRVVVADVVVAAAVGDWSCGCC